MKPVLKSTSNPYLYLRIKMGCHNQSILPSTSRLYTQALKHTISIVNEDISSQHPISIKHHRPALNLMVISNPHSPPPKPLSRTRSLQLSLSTTRPPAPNSYSDRSLNQIPQYPILTHACPHPPLPSPPANPLPCNLSPANQLLPSIGHLSIQPSHSRGIKNLKRYLHGALDPGSYRKKKCLGDVSS